MQKIHLILVFFFCQILLAQEPFYINYSTSDGFPTSMVYSASQDKDGLLWFCTDSGLVKYDSRSFTVYNTDNGLTDNEVFQMKTDFKGRTWILTLNGKPSYIYKGVFYNERNSALVRKIAGTNLIVDIFQDSQNRIYFAFRDGYIATVFPDDKVEKRFSSIASLNGIWMNNSGLNVLHGKGIFNLTLNKNILDKRSGEYYRVYHQEDNTYYSETNKLFEVDSNNGSKRIAEIPQKIEIINILIEKNKTWICTRSGLFLFENNVLKKRFFENYAVSSLLQDFEGGYWITTLKNGVIYVPSFDVFVDTINSESNNLKINCISLKGSEIWLGSDNNDYYVKKGKSFSKKVILRNNSNRVDQITNIRFSNNETYIISKLEVVKIDSNGVETNCGFSGDDLLIDNDNIFIGSTSTFKFSAKKIDEIDIHNFASNILIKKRGTVLSKGENTIWIGTNFGLYSYTKKDSIVFWGNKDQKLETSINDLFYDEESKTLLVASSSKGIIGIKGTTIIQRINSTIGFNSAICNTIKKIAPNYYLIGTNNGLNSLSIEGTTFKVKNLNSFLGIKNKKINDIEYLNNLVYLATDNGLLYFNLKDIEGKKSIPKCAIVHLKNNNKIISNKKYQFSYDNCDISIQFAGISYINQGNLIYFYRLNSKSEWSTSNETQINYKSLPPGKYIFSVYCSNGFGIKSKTQTIAFEILPPFWQKLWFFLLVAALLLSGIYFFMRYRLKKQQKRFEEEKKTIQIERDKANLEKQMVELEQKALRMQMNPHFIFNALNTIKGYYTEGNYINASTYISKFSKLLRKLLESEEQITTLDNEIDMLKLYIELTQIRYEGKFDFSIVVSDDLTKEDILIPNLLLQPLVENAIIHGLGPKSEKGFLKIEFEQKDENLICCVDDNGIGRKAALKNQKNKEHNSKAMEITTERLQLFDSSSTMKIIDKFDDHQKSLGTKVIITLPLKYNW